MLPLLFAWLTLSVAGALYLCWRLPRDYYTAKYYAEVRTMVLRMQQGFRMITKAMLGCHGYEKTLEQLRLF
jgi:hypothetical protein